MGLKTLLSEAGFKVPRARLHIDASAALGISQRKGVGRVRHLSVGVLWIQEQQLRKALEMTKRHGPRNPADVLTKCLAAQAVDHIVLGIRCRDGAVALSSETHDNPLTP